MKFGIWVCFLLMLSDCAPKTEALDPDYLKEIEQWHAKRIERLKGPSGWLNVAGLFWLKNGISSFGTGQDNDIVFPSALGAEKAGFFVLENGTVKQLIREEVVVTSSGLPVKELVVYNPDSSRQQVMEAGSLQWFIIKRDSKYGVRLRDFNHAALTSFHGVDRYPVDASWKVIAHWEATPGRTIAITNILGQTTPQASPGTLVFTLDGNEFRLDALDEGDPDELFIIFGDDTNAKETYGAGRYLYVPRPNAQGQVTLDFNKSQNPPCAFTDFATCPLPPIQNVLSLGITAGEKDFKHP
jgi:uncharacterized protein (DUF1684 family)